MITMAPTCLEKSDKTQGALTNNICGEIFSEHVYSYGLHKNNNTIDISKSKCASKVNNVPKNGLTKNTDISESATSEEFNLKAYEEIEFRAQLRWPDLTVQVFLHGGSLYGFYLAATSASIYTILFVFATIYTTGFGITAGAHRLWSHRTYKAKWPLRLLLVLLFTVTGQRDVYTWALDHRVHHKYSETVADPHDARRGFLFSHIGWLVLTPHPAVQHQRKVVDVSDLRADPIVTWQKKFYIPLFALLNIVLPTLIPVWYFDETIWNSFWISFVTRFTINLNIAFCVNSVAHLWGNKPYDKHILPVENALVSLAALGEGWHNYHHVFPWDYKTSELGHYAFNITTGFIDLFSKLGWAYDLKFVSAEMIARRIAKNGGTLPDHNAPGSPPPLWGYGDRDIPRDDADELAQMTNGVHPKTT